MSYRIKQASRRRCWPSESGVLVITPTRFLLARKVSPRLSPHSGDVSSVSPKVPPLEVGGVGPSPVPASCHVLLQRPPLPQTSARIVKISGHRFRTECEAVPRDAQTSLCTVTFTRRQMNSTVLPTSEGLLPVPEDTAPGKATGHGPGHLVGFLLGVSFLGNHVIETSSNRQSERAQ